MRLVECVPNFSEGRDRAVLDEIARAIESVQDAQVLDIDPGAATNRTVLTFVASPEAAVEAAFAAIRVASERIDMRGHQGEHARQGATDVCPFVPLQGTSMTDCVELARQLGQRVGDELGIPVYLYEEAATHPDRRNLATVRSGEYEGLEAKLRDPNWKPDFGPTQFNPRSGATAIGAREFLVAYNINLNTRDKNRANDIALDLREAGRLKRAADGSVVRDASGQALRVPGLFKHVKAVGWYIEEYGMAQISINFTNTKVTPIHAVFDAACSEAQKRGLRVTGSELVGLCPLDAILAAGRHYLRQQKRTTGVPVSELVHTAVRSLGLGELRPFDPADKIVEYRVRNTGDSRLRDMGVAGFTDLLSTEAPAPGGGSAAALAGALAAALAAMVAALTHAPDATGASDLEALAVQGQALKDELLTAVDRDAGAFDAMLAARRMPRKSEADARARDVAMRQATREATSVPLGVLQGASRAAALARQASALGNPASLSDAGAAACLAGAASEGAYYNVLINLAELQSDEDAHFVTETRRVAHEALESARQTADAVQRDVRSRLEAPR